MKEYYAFRIQQRYGEGHTLLLEGRLSHQYLVDAYTAIEQNTLNFIKWNQPKIRTDLYKGLYDAVQQGDTVASRVGQMYILPSTFTGGVCYKIQNYQDAMALCR